MISSLTFSTGGFTESSSWTVALDLTQVDPMYLGDREAFDDWIDVDLDKNYMKLMADKVMPQINNNIYIAAE